MFSPVKADVSMKSTPNLEATDRPSYATHFGGDHPFVGQVNLVADKQNPDIFGRQVLDLVHPLVNRLEARLVGHAVGYDDSVRR